MAPCVHSPASPHTHSTPPSTSARRPHAFARTLLVLRAASAQAHQRPPPAAPVVGAGTARSSDFTDPLEPYEEDPRPSLGGLVAWLASTLAPLLPPGMRHTAMPRAGALARCALGGPAGRRLSEGAAPLRCCGRARRLHKIPTRSCPTLPGRNRIIALGKDSQSRMLQREPRSMRRRTRLVLESLASEGLASAKYTPAAAAAAAEGGQEKLGAGKPSEAAEV